MSTRLENVFITVGFPDYILETEAVLYTAIHMRREDYCSVLFMLSAVKSFLSVTLPLSVFVCFPHFPHDHVVVCVFSDCFHHSPPCQ